VHLPILIVKINSYRPKVRDINLLLYHLKASGNNGLPVRQIELFIDYLTTLYRQL